MAFQTSFCIVMAIFITSISSSQATTFQVGGKDGWTLRPSESYNNWSSRLRFLINDTLHFKYNGASDSVLVVNKGDFDGCNANNPITKLDGGDSSFKFDRSGPFYFITGNKSNCDQGQKLIVVVLALRNRSPPPAVATPPSPAVSPPSRTPGLTPPANSPGGGSAPSPGGGGGGSSGGNNPSGDTTSPPAQSAATPRLLGTIIAWMVTVMFALWGLY
ncbi:early nodulin-like protein 1 [Bidens hawaiensis]|uniref:early nodulin-like protein 1 n=1 Tax=Bidens hawaiensis TaxID=980011 RepID=UPI00404A2CE6